MKTRIVAATEFKAKCLALLNEVDEKGNTITITRRGRAVATLQRPKKAAFKSPRGALIGKFEIVGDIVNQDTSHLWSCLRD